MYLSRLKLEPTARTTRTLCLNPYLLHQAVFRAFSDKVDGGPGRVLYRVDVSNKGEIALYVQSEKKPEWDKAQLLTACLSRVVGGPVATRPFAPVFAAGQYLRFRLRANPVAKRRTPDHMETTRRLGLIHEEEQIKWLQRKAAEGGFALLKCTATPEGKIVDQKGENDHKHTFTHFAVRFDGTLKVFDPGAFANALKDGIGPAKGFGFGLLSLAAIKD